MICTLTVIIHDKNIEFHHLSIMQGLIAFRVYLLGGKQKLELHFRFKKKRIYVFIDDSVFFNTESKAQTYILTHPCLNSARVSWAQSRKRDGSSRQFLRSPLAGLLLSYFLHQKTNNKKKKPEINLFELHKEKYSFSKQKKKKKKMKSSFE